MTVGGLAAAPLVLLALLLALTRRGRAPAHVAVDGSRVVVGLRGLNRLWALRRTVVVPIECLRSVEVVPSAGRLGLGIRSPGTYAPWVVTAGTFRRRGRKTFAAFRPGHSVVALDLVDARYDRIVVEVDDPQRTVQELTP